MSSKKKKIITAIVASLTGVSAASVLASIMAYDAVFPRYERPNYALQPGQYCIDRFDDLSREEVWIPSGKNRLKTYIYQSKEGKGLVFFAHGMRSGSDDYLPIIKYLVDNGFTVVAHNVTGTFESEGDSTVGMCQSLVDLDKVIDYFQKDGKYKNMPFFTMGHSWGGYASTAVLSLKKGIRATAVIAAMRSATTMATEKGEQYVGKIAKMSAPIFACYQKLLFGKYIECDAIKGINDSNIPVIVAHGVDDNVITFEKQSIVAHRNEITNPKVEYYIGKGLQAEHSSIWHSTQAIIYQKQVESELKALEFEKGEELTEQEKIEFYSNVDHRLYSEINYELMDKIIDLFNANL